MGDGRGLSLDCAQHNALHEELLDEGIQHQNRHGGNDDQGVLQQVLTRLIVQHGFLIDGDAGSLGEAVLDQDGAQGDLQRHLVGVHHVEEGGEIIIPVADRVIQRQNGHDGLGQRKNHLKEVAEIGAAVDLGGLFDIVRDVLDEGAGDDHVVNADRTGNDHGPDGIDHAQILDQQVAGNGTAAEEHGEHEQRYDNALKGKTLAGQRVGGDHGHRQIDDRTGDGVDEGIAIGTPDAGVLKYRLIAFKRGLNRPEQNSALIDDDGVRERGGHDVEQRQQDDHEERKQEYVHQRVVDFIDARSLDSVLRAGNGFHRSHCFLPSFLTRVRCRSLCWK